MVIGLALSAAAAYNLYQLVPVSYTANASVVLLPPKTLFGEGGNPFLYLGGLNQAVDVLTRKVTSDEISKPIERANPDSEFEVVSDTSSSGPILVITGHGPTKSAAIAVMTDVLDVTAPALEELQTSLAVTPDSLITIDTLAVDEKPKIDQKNRLQAVLGAGGGGVVLTLLLAAFLDSRLLLRRARKTAKAEAEAIALRKARMAAMVPTAPDLEAPDPDLVAKPVVPKAHKPTVHPVHARTKGSTGAPRVPRKPSR